MDFIKNNCGKKKIKKDVAKLKLQRIEQVKFVCVLFKAFRIVLSARVLTI